MDQKVWVFDLDGTLIQTAPTYGVAALEFIRLMFDVFGWKSPRWMDIGQMLEGIDEERRYWGGYRGRFPGSLVICYWRLCRELNVPYDEEIARYVWHLGKAALAEERYHPGQLIPGTEELLTALTVKGAIIYIVTKGDPVVQRRKWKKCGLSRWVPEERFIVVQWGPCPGHSGDKTEALIRIRGSHPDQEVFMVGDSVTSDIIPALVAGMTPVHIRSYWVWEQAGQNLPLPDRVLQLERVVEILEHYDDL